MRNNMTIRRRTLRRVLPALVISLALFYLQPLEAQAETVTVRVVVWDDTEKKPLPGKAEIWIRGLGSWWIAKEDMKNVADREIGAIDTIYVYPDGRSGKELKVSFKMTAEMCPQGCARDLISVEVSDTEVAVGGTPIKAAKEKSEVKSSRQ